MVSKTVATFTAATDARSLPPEVAHAAKRSLLNFFATALEGTHDVAVETTLETLRPFAGAGRATLIGRAERTDAMTAALINAAAANVHDFDDTHLRTVIHPTAPVAPPLLALAEQRLVTGPEFINALALGIEFTCRIGNAV
ncbi:MAG: MmgE/PrpD family protein, partial [Alphaproteobacteria bacterium]|nr:MmgE/PrpD family protein [Alphaproteobacteria bacterium]